MKPDELKTKVEELEVLLKTGNDHALAETQARELLVDDALANVPELHCRTLLALSESLLSTIPQQSHHACDRPSQPGFYR